ncbi:hypothetical protein [Cupriavidus sp. D39]|uniref:hypothetical protein n=1 Tax=Cupriavidus sp. D39 TaxID=2997877 RepID=UPI00226DB123|nr:hypothetical protein [Cupriavidus sp. D39]MCY0852845.1 hypothetical protein [Cupriavidus sp. D39]
MQRQPEDGLIGLAEIDGLAGEWMVHLLLQRRAIVEEDPVQFARAPSRRPIAPLGHEVSASPLMSAVGNTSGIVGVLRVE